MTYEQFCIKIKNQCKKWGVRNLPPPDLKKTKIVNSRMFRKQLVFRGKEIEGYFIDQYGNIISDKNFQLLGRYLSPSVSGKSPYPQLTISVDGKGINTSVHRVVCETYHPFPKSYPGISQKDWKKTPISVKKELMKTMQVNHIDGDVCNFHPANLEWVTQLQNIHHYQKQLRKKI